MTTVIRPIGIENADLRHGRIALFVVLEIILNMLEILEGHRQTKGIIEIPKVLFGHVGETIEDRYVCRIIKLRDQGLRLLHACLPRIHGVDAISFDLCEFLFRYVTLDHVGNGRANNGVFILIEELNTLYCGICSLIELTGKEFH